MPMTNSGRAQAIYDQIATSANFGQLSPTEKTALRAQLELIWGTGDLTYITGNAQVNPGTLANPVGQAVLIPSTSAPSSPSTGATSAPQVITGLGTVS